MIEPRPYQAQILKELKDLAAIALFMKTGSGKTYTALFKVRDNDTKSLLVICPKRIVEQWEESIKQVLLDYELVEFKKSATSKERSDLLKKTKDYDKKAVIISLESVSRIDALPKIITEDWTVIVDESHRIKEYGSLRNPVKVTRKVLQIGEKTLYKIILSATPTQKNKGGYIDYYTQLRFLGYIDYDIGYFKQKYCLIEKKQFPGMPFPIDIIKGYKNTEELDHLLQLCGRFYAPKYGEFEPEHVEVKLPAPTHYKKLVRDKAYKDLDLRQLTARRIAYKTITTGVCLGHDNFQARLYYEDNTIKADWLTDFLKDTDETVLIFYSYNVELDTLKKVCKKLDKKYIVINGANTNKYATIMNEEYDVILGQFEACGESIDNLQYKCHICIYYAMPESSRVHRQALGRIDRDGQVDVPIYYYLIAEGTLEEKIYELTKTKTEYSEIVLDKLLLKEEYIK